MKTLELFVITEKKKLKYTVEQPDNDEEYSRGLAGRDLLPEKHGMIYLKKKGW